MYTHPILQVYILVLQQRAVHGTLCDRCLHCVTSAHGSLVAHLYCHHRLWLTSQLTLYHQHHNYSFEHQRNFGCENLIGQYMSRATHTHYFPCRHVNQQVAYNFSVGASFVSGFRDLLAVGTMSHCCQCEQLRVSVAWRDEI